jgi:hypothetical protein
MIARLGVSIHAGEVRALLVQRGDVRWRSSLACEYSAASAAETFERLLAALPKRLTFRRATVAIGPLWCQVKRIEGLPAGRDLALLTKLLRENSASFFLRGTTRLAVSDVTCFPDGSLWAAAFDQEIVASVIETLKRLGFGDLRIVPSVSAIASILPSGAWCWRDAEQVMELTIGEHRAFTRVRRVAMDVEVVQPPLSGPLKKLGDEAWENSAAFGAAFSRGQLPFAWRPAPDPKRLALASKIRMGTAAVLSAIAAVGAVGAPGARASRLIRDESGELASLRASQTEVARAQGELRRAAATLDRVERFREQRGKITMLLGAISRTLPESTALVTLRVDTLEGTFVAITPHAADILSQLADVSDIVQPKIVGSLTKETMGPVQLERATVRFKRSALPKSLSSESKKPGGRN